MQTNKFTPVKSYVFINSVKREFTPKILDGSHFIVFLMLLIAYKLDHSV